MQGFGLDHKMKRSAWADLFTLLSLRLPRQEAGSLSPPVMAWMRTKSQWRCWNRAQARQWTTVSLSSKELPSTSAQEPSPWHSWTDWLVVCSTAPHPLCIILLLGSPLCFAWSVLNKGLDTSSGWMKSSRQSGAWPSRPGGISTEQLWTRCQHLSTKSLKKRTP